ncbi:MAG: DUF349 domain-containing protein [Muribaculaceae bacterium]
MNELDKLSPGADDLNLEVAAETAAMSTAATSATGNAECDNTCVETTSPSADIAEAADAAEADECAVESSPAEDLAKVADEITEKPEENVVSEKNYHSMSKQEMIEALREIVSSGDMEAHKEVAAVKQAFYSLLNKEAMNAAKAFVEEGNPADQFSAPVDEDEVKIKALLAEFREKRSAYLEEKEEERKKNLEEKSRIVAELKAIAEDIDNINLHFPKFQQLQQDFKAVGEVPAGSENEIWRSYQSSVEQFYDRLKMNKELRDLDFKKNLEIKQLLVEKARQLTTLPDPIEAFRKLQDLHDQWREIGPVAKEVREDIWNEFKEASAMINKRHQDYFQSRKAEETDNEIAKTALCEKVEAVDLAALKTFAEWDAKTKEILEIQKAYKEIGFAPRKSNGVLFSRFRKACDAFFTTKAEYFKKTKDEFRDNLAKKEALCEKAEALLPRAEEKEAYDELQELQKEWRTVGVVRRKQGDEVWKRFCAAIDAFHDARKKHFGAQRSAENENLKAKQAIIARLKAISTDAERKDVIESIRQLQNEWQQTGFVPFKHKDAVNAEYRAELSRLFGAFDLRESRQRMRRFEGELKKMDGDESRISRERERLVRAIESRQSEIKTIENNLGFFKFSSGGNMVKEYERKIAKIKEDIAQIQDKINLLDAQEKQSNQ